MNTISKAVEIIGGPIKAAAALGVSHQAVRSWMSGTRGFPAGLAPSVEKLTDGAVRCEDLAPGVEWSVLREPVEAA